MPILADECLLFRLPVEWCCSGQHFEQNGAEGINVRSHVVVESVANLLWRHILLCLQLGRTAGQLVSLSDSLGRRQAGHFDPAVGCDEYAVGCETAMNDSYFVQMFDSVGNGANDANCFGFGHCAFTLDPTLQRFGCEKFSHEEMHAAVLANLQPFDKVGMTELNGKPSLLVKPNQIRLVAGHSRMQCGERDIASIDRLSVVHRTRCVTTNATEQAISADRFRHDGSEYRIDTDRLTRSFRLRKN